MRLFVRSRSARVLTGAEEMIGASAEVLESVDNGYYVRCHGETWQAMSENPLKVGQKVRVTGRDGLILKVKE
jgi:membrane-bound serine protease (ClpP class)